MSGSFPGARGDPPEYEPDPGYARRLGLTPAPEGRRSLAFLIDAFAVLILGVPAIIAMVSAVPIVVGSGFGGLLASGGVTPVLLLVSTVLVNLFLLIQLILHGRRGVTVGKALMGLRSVGVGRFDRPGFWRIVLRALVLQLSATLLPVIGGVLLLVSGLWDGERRGRSLLDRVASIWLIDARGGLDPFDAKALRLARKREAAAPAAAAGPTVSMATGAPPAMMDVGHRSRSAVVGISAPTASVDVLGRPPEPRPPTPQPPQHGQVLPPPRGIADEAPTPPAVALVDDDGVAFEVGERALIGRGPVAGPGEAAAILLHVDDPSFSVSKTHAVLGVDGGGLWIEDRGSRNGSVVVDENGRETVLTSGSRHRVATSDILYLGTRRFSVLTKGSVE